MYGYDVVMDLETKRLADEIKESNFYSQEDADKALERRVGYVRSALDEIKPTGNENIPVMREVLAYAKAEQDRGFNMDIWFGKEDDDEYNAAEIRVAQGEPLVCGTTMCLAGTAAFLTLADNEVITNKSTVFALNSIGRKKPNTVVNIDQRGADVMGLNDHQSEVLFYVDNDIAIVEAYMNYVAGEQLLS